MEQTNADDVHDVRLTVRLDEQTMSAIRSQAHQERRSVSAMARILIDRGLGMRQILVDLSPGTTSGVLGQIKAEMLASMHGGSPAEEAKDARQAQARAALEAAEAKTGVRPPIVASFDPDAEVES